MPRAKLIHRPRKLTLHLPEDVVARLDLFLFSTALSKIPEGSYQRFFTDRIVEFFDMEVVMMPDGEPLRMSKKDAAAVRRKLTKLASMEADVDSLKVAKDVSLARIAE